MMASMHVHAVGREPLPRVRTAAMRWSCGGEEEEWVVQRRTATRMEEVARLVDTVALIKEALSLKMSKSCLSCFLGAMD